jgi:hypothetical protein
MVRTRRRAKDFYPDPCGLVESDENDLYEEENDDSSSDEEVKKVRVSNVNAKRKRGEHSSVWGYFIKDKKEDT